MPPPTSVTMRGNTSVIWGTNGTYSGIINSAKRKDGAEKVVVEDNDGFVVTAIYFNFTNECEFEMVVQSSIPELTPGTLITVAGVVNCIVDESEVNWKKKDVVSYNVKATKYAKI